MLQLSHCVSVMKTCYLYSYTKCMNVDHLCPRFPALKYWKFCSQTSTFMQSVGSKIYKQCKLNLIQCIHWSSQVSIICKSVFVICWCTRMTCKSLEQYYLAHWPVISDVTYHKWKKNKFALHPSCNAINNKLYISFHLLFIDHTTTAFQQTVHISKICLLSAWEQFSAWWSLGGFAMPEDEASTCATAFAPHDYVAALSWSHWTDGLSASANSLQYNAISAGFGSVRLLEDHGCTALSSGWGGWCMGICKWCRDHTYYTFFTVDMYL